MAQINPPREYKFVTGYSHKRRRRAGPSRGGRKTVPAPKQPSQPQSQLHSENSVRPQNHVVAQPNNQEPEPEMVNTDVNFNLLNELADWSYDTLIDPGQHSTASFFDQLGGHHQNQMLFPDGLSIVHHDLGDPTRNVLEDLGSASTHSSLEESVSPPLLNSSTNDAAATSGNSNNIGQTITQLIARYDQEFCIMPLTHDFAANPFRFTVETSRCSQLLLHCILALSYKHIHRDTGACLNESRMHKSKALQMLNELDRTTPPLEPNFLDAVLLLMTLDCATSAHGPWVWYLKRARKIIQATESLGVQKTLRMQARIEMLVWWDVTQALTNRQGCVLPESTIMSVVNGTSTSTSTSTFHSVSGCSEELFKHMVHLGSYARELELTFTMVCATFDMGPVLAVEKSIKNWIDPEYDDLYNEYSGSSSSLHTKVVDESVADMMHYKEDLHHCAEAWRYGLLLYIERVFKWRQASGTTPSPILGFLSRRTLNHVTACSRSGSGSGNNTTMVQKQLLLPVFLAGCETRDENLRREARDYCSWWNEKTRYGMFLTALELMEEVWDVCDQGDKRAWWGSVMKGKRDGNVEGYGGGLEARQYLFG